MFADALLKKLAEIARKVIRYYIETASRTTETVFSCKSYSNNLSFTYNIIAAACVNMLVFMVYGDSS